MPQGGLGYQSTNTLSRRLEQTAPADPMRTGQGRLHSGQRPQTSGQVFTDRQGVYSRQTTNDAKSNKMPQITDQRQNLQQKQQVPPIPIRTTTSKEVQG